MLRFHLKTRSWPLRTPGWAHDDMSTLCGWWRISSPPWDFVAPDLDAAGDDDDVGWRPVAGWWWSTIQHFASHSPRMFRLGSGSSLFAHCIDAALCHGAGTPSMDRSCWHRPRSGEAVGTNPPGEHALHARRPSHNPRLWLSIDVLYGCCYCCRRRRWPHHQRWCHHRLRLNSSRLAVGDLLGSRWLAVSSCWQWGERERCSANDATLQQIQKALMNCPKSNLTKRTLAKAKNKCFLGVWMRILEEVCQWIWKDTLHGNKNMERENNLRSKMLLEVDSLTKSDGFSLLYIEPARLRKRKGGWEKN